MKKRTSNFRSKLSSMFKAIKTFQLYPKIGCQSKISTTEELIQSSWGKTGQALKDAVKKEIPGAAINKKDPFPDPSRLTEYALLDKDLPDRIFSEFEKSLVVARQYESQELELKIKEQQRGQLMAFSIFVLLMLAIFYSLYIEEYSTACILGVVYAELLALSFLF